MRQIYFDIDFADWVEYLEDEFFTWKPPVVLPKVKPTIVEQIEVEREYRRKRMKLLPQNESQKVYYEVTLEMSRENEARLIRKLERRNEAVGDVDKARSYPIEELIQFKHGFALCPFHKEKTPSFHLIPNTNRAYCFSCARAFDSIDVAKAVWGCSFKEAIKRLT